MPKYHIAFAPTGPDVADVVLLVDDVCLAQVLGADRSTVLYMMAVTGVQPWDIENTLNNCGPGTLVTSENGTLFTRFEITPAAYKFLSGKSK